MVPFSAKGFTVLGAAMDEEGKRVVALFVQTERFRHGARRQPMNYPILLGNDATADKFGGLLGFRFDFQGRARGEARGWASELRRNRPSHAIAFVDSAQGKSLGRRQKKQVSTGPLSASQCEAAKLLREDTKNRYSHSLCGKRGS